MGLAGVPELFVLLGAIMFLGFGGNFLFERTKISDLLILFLVGFLLGPVTRVADTNFFISLVPFFSSLALIILLFDGGLNLNFYKALNELSRATAFALAALVFTIVFAAGGLHFLLGWNIFMSLLMGAVIGGTSSEIVIPLVNKATGKEETKTLLKLESALTDAFVVVIAIALVQVMLADSISIQLAANALFGAFTIAAVAGAIAGAVWLRALKHFKQQQYYYLMALATLFLLYGFVESVKGNGAISALVFGLMLGNSAEIAKALRLQEDYGLGSSFKRFQSEISFFVRTFFFVYLGIIFKLTGLEIAIVVAAMAVFAAIALARAASVQLLVRGANNSQDRSLMTLMFPRGLAPAVLASLPASSGLSITKFPEILSFSEVVLLVVLFTNVFTTAALFWYERKYSPRQADSGDKPKIVQVGEKTRKK